MSDLQTLEFNAADLENPGWAASILLGVFRTVPEGTSMSVLSHIDSMVEEGANEALRRFTGRPTVTLREVLESPYPDAYKLAMVAVDQSLWDFAYKFNGFVELYERARTSLQAQQMGVLTQLATGAMERLVQLEQLLPASIPESLTAMMETLSSNRLVASFFQEFRESLTRIASLTTEVEDYSGEVGTQMREFVRERFSFSGWFTLAQSALEPAPKSAPSSSKSPSI